MSFHVMIVLIALQPGARLAVDQLHLWVWAELASMWERPHFYQEEACAVTAEQILSRKKLRPQIREIRVWACYNPQSDALQGYRDPYLFDQSDFSLIISCKDSKIVKYR